MLLLWCGEVLATSPAESPPHARCSRWVCGVDSASLRVHSSRRVAAASPSPASMRAAAEAVSLSVSAARLACRGRHAGRQQSRRNRSQCGRGHLVKHHQTRLHTSSKADSRPICLQIWFSRDLISDLVLIRSAFRSAFRSGSHLICFQICPHTCHHVCVSPDLLPSPLPPTSSLPRPRRWLRPRRDYASSRLPRPVPRAGGTMMTWGWRQLRRLARIFSSHPFPVHAHIYACRC